MAFRHECSLRLTGPSSLHTDGPGKPARQKCGYCGGAFIVREGCWGVFVWTWTGDYPESNAITTRERQAAANAFAHRDGNLVVRWIDTGPSYVHRKDSR